MVLTLEEINALSPEDKAQMLLNLSQKEEEARMTLTKREQEMAQGVEKLKDRSNYLELLKDEAKNLIADKNYFADLLDKDEVLAKAVLDEYFNGMSVEEALEQVEGGKKFEVESKLKQKEIDNSVESKINEALTKREIDREIKGFIKEMGLTVEEEKSFMSEFADITEGKKLDETKLDKYLKIALKESFPDYNAKKIEQEAMEMTRSNSSNNASKQSQIGQARKSNIEYLKKAGILR